MMCNGNLECSLKGCGNSYGINWIRDLNDAQNPRRMLLVDIQCLIVHIMGQLLECKCVDVISAVLEFQFTNHSSESYLEFRQRNGTWPFAKLLNFSRGTIDLHGVYWCRGHDL